MMAGVGVILSGVGVMMYKDNPRTGAISFASALLLWGLTSDLVYVVAVSVTLASIDYVFVQGKRVNIMEMAVKNGQELDRVESDSYKFWTKEYWSEFKLVKPTFDRTSITYALGFMCLNIGTNISFGNVTAAIAGTSQNIDHLTIINAVADIPSVMFGGAPLGAIISGTAASPWPVMAGISMMFLCGIILLLGLMTKIAKFIPVESIAGFLFVIGFFPTFIPNVTNAFATGYPSEAGAAMAVTVLTKNPFFGLTAGIAVRYLGQFVGL